MTLFVLAVGLLKLGISVILAVGVVFVTYKVFIKANTDFDESLEIRKGNVAVGILVAALLVASANIIYQGLEPLLNLLAVHFASTGPGLPLWKLVSYGFGHLFLAFSLSIVTMSFSLRLFGRLTRPAMRAGLELQHGNVAVGILLAGVVFVVGLYIGEGVHALSKALIPQPTMGRIQIMR